MLKAYLPIVNCSRLVQECLRAGAMNWTPACLSLKAFVIRRCAGTSFHGKTPCITRYGTGRQVLACIVLAMQDPAGTTCIMTSCVDHSLPIPASLPELAWPLTCS